MNPLAFLGLAALTVASAVTVVVHRNPVHSACALVATLFLLSVFFVGLDAHLVAALQIVVYAGAVVVLFLFVIMLLNLPAEPRITGGPVLAATAALGSLVLIGFLAAGVGHDARATPELATDYGQTRTLAHRLFTDYLLPFELTSVLLLVAIVGAIAVAQKRD